MAVVVRNSRPLRDEMGAVPADEVVTQLSLTVLAATSEANSVSEPL
jgi:hypothetical protein